MRIVRLSDLSEEERKKALEEQENRYKSNKVASEQIRQNANQQFNEYIEKHGAYDTNKHATTIGDLRKAYKNTANYNEVKKSLNNYYKNNKVSLWNQIQNIALGTKVDSRLKQVSSINNDYSSQAQKNYYDANFISKTQNANNVYQQAVKDRIRNSIAYKNEKFKNPNLSDEELLKRAENEDSKITTNFMNEIISKNGTERSVKLKNISKSDTNPLFYDNSKFRDLNSEVLQYKTFVDAQKEADKINQDLENKKIGSSIGHVLTMLPQKAMEAVASPIYATGSLLNLKLPTGTADQDLKDWKSISSKYDQVTANIDNKTVRTASNVAGTIGYMVPSILASMVSPEANLGRIAQGISVAGQSYNENLNEDSSNKFKSLLTGIGKGYASYAIEGISGGNILGKGSLDDWAVKTIASKTANNASKKIASMVYEVGGEVFEETLENQVDYLVDKVVNNKGITLNDWLGEQKETVKDTVLSTLVLKVLGLGGNTYKDIKEYEYNVDTKKWINEAERIIEKENLKVYKNKFNVENNNLEVHKVLDSIEKENDTSNLQQNTTKNQNILPTQQITSQENKVPYNQNIEQINNSNKQIQDNRKKSENKIKLQDKEVKYINKNGNQEDVYFRFDNVGEFKGKEHQSGVSMWEEYVDEILYPDYDAYDDSAKAESEIDNKLEPYGITYEEYDNMTDGEKMKIKREVALDNNYITDGASCFKLDEDGIEELISYLVMHPLDDYKEVNFFTGKENGFGADGEYIIKPDEIIKTNDSEQIFEIIENEELNNIEKLDKIVRNIANNKETLYNNIVLGDIKNVPIESVLQLKTDGGYRNEQQMENLRKDIKENGIKNPIELVINKDGSIQIENGNHRLQVAKELGLKKVPIKFVESWDNIGINIDMQENIILQGVDKKYDTMDRDSGAINSFNARFETNKRNSINNRNEFENRKTTEENDRIFNRTQEYNNRPSGNSTSKQNSQELDKTSSFKLPTKEYFEKKAVRNDKKINLIKNDTITNYYMQNVDNNMQNIEVKNDKSQIYRNTANTNKLIKEKNNKIRELEKSIQQATSQKEKNILLKQIDDIQSEYSSKMNELFDDIDKIGKNMDKNGKDNINNNKLDNISFRSSDEIANDTKISDLQAIKEETKKTNIPELDTVDKVEKELRKNSVESTPTILYIKKKRSKEKVGLLEIKDTLAQGFVNKGHYIDKLANKTGNKNLTYLYDRTMNTFNESQISIGDYQINSKGDVVGKSIIDIFQPAEDMKVSIEFEDYLLNKHNISRYAHEKGLFGKEISSTDSQSIVNKYEKQFPQFKEWAKEVSKYNDNNIRDLVDNGLVSEQTYNNLKKMYGDYVPTFRDITDNVAQYVDDRVGGNTIKRATENNFNILSVKESMAEQTLAIKKAIRINNLGVELYKTLGKDSTITTGIDFDAVAMQTIAGNVIDSEGKGKNTFTIFQDGEMTQFKISDELYSAFSKDTLQNKINNSKVAKAILTPVEKMSKAQRELLTTYSVGFALNNPIKDFQDAMFNTKYSGGRFVKNWTKALYNIATDGSWYQNYKNNGGTANTYFDYDKGILPTNTKNPVKKFVDNIKNANNVLEQAPRLAEYISTIETGGSIDEALYNAAEITTNFKRGGDITKAVNKYGANFLNASVQGLDKLYRNVSGQNGWKGYANLLTKATIYQIAPAMINGLLLGDDDDYENLQEYTKDNYFLFKTGKGKFFRIPKGRISSVIGGLARRVLETVQGKNVDWKSLIDTTFNQLAPNNPFSDNIIAPIKQAFDNKTWYGGEIVNSRLQKLPTAEQSDESTDKLSKFIGEKLNISPKKINYVLDQYSGGIGDILLPIMTPQAENNILEDKFTTDSVMKNKHVSEYYSKLDEYEKNKNSAKATDEDKLKYKYMMEVSKDLSDLYSKKREIQNSNKSNKVKRDEIREIQAQINSIVEERLDTSNIVNKTETTANIGESEYYKYKDEWIKLSDEEKEKNKQIPLRTYADYRNKVYSKEQNKKNNGELSEKQELKNKDKVQILLDSNYSDKEKKELYKNYISSSDKKIILVEKLGLSIDSYLEYKTYEFENDKDEDGETIRGSRKTKVLRYLNNIPDRTLSREYKQIIYKIEGYNNYDKEIVDNIRSNKSLSFSEQNNILEIIGFKVDKKGNITTTTILPINKAIK